MEDESKNYRRNVKTPLFNILFSIVNNRKRLKTETVCQVDIGKKPFCLKPGVARGLLYKQLCDSTTDSKASFRIFEIPPGLVLWRCNKEM